MEIEGPIVLGASNARTQNDAKVLYIEWGTIGQRIRRVWTLLRRCQIVKQVEIDKSSPLRLTSIGINIRD